MSALVSLRRQPLPHPFTLDGSFKQQGVNQHEAVPEQLLPHSDHLLLFTVFRGEFALPTIADEVTGRVPVFHDIEPFLDFPLFVAGYEILTPGRWSFPLYPLPPGLYT